MSIIAPKFGLCVVILLTVCGENSDNLVSQMFCSRWVWKVVQKETMKEFNSSIFLIRNLRFFTKPQLKNKVLSEEH